MTPPPETEFVPGDKGDANVFAIESIAYGSTPTSDDDRYPGIDRALEIFDRSIDRLATAVEALDEDALHLEHRWGASTQPAWKLIMRVALHNGTHAGQMTDTRRALAMDPVIG